MSEFLFMVYVLVFCETLLDYTYVMILEPTSDCNVQSNYVIYISIMPYLCFDCVSIRLCLDYVSIYVLTVSIRLCL